MSSTNFGSQTRKTRGLRLDGNDGILLLMISKEALSQLKKVFQFYPVEAAYLFGSQIKGRAGKLSDVDVAVLFREKAYSLDLLLELIGKLKTVLKREDVDLIPLNDASPVLKHQAALSGQRLYAKDKEKVLEFEKRVLQEYEDTTFLRKVYYQYMEERITNNQFGEFPK